MNNMATRNEIYNLLDLYEPEFLDAQKLLEILAKEEIVVTKDEFEDILEEYYQGIGEEM